MRARLAAGLGTLSAALLKPMLWVLAPAVVLAALARDNGRPGLPRAAAGAVAILVPGLAGALALNAALYGRATDFGYGYVGLPFDHPLSEGLAGLLISPGRGLLFFAPVALLAPPLGQAVLVARGAGIRVDAPWLAPGVLEGMPLPPPSVWLFPAIPRRLAGLPPITPVSALLLARIAVAEASRGRPEVAALHASESLALDPGQRDSETLRLLAEPRPGAGAGPDREIRSRDPNGGMR